MDGDALSPAASCLVTPERRRVLDDTLGKFFRDTPVLAQVHWRTALESALSATVSAVLEHTRPRQVRVALVVESDVLVATVSEGGQWWQGEPAPEHLLDDLRATGVLPFDDVRHRLDGTGHSWVIRRQITTPRPAGRPGRFRLERAKLAELVAATVRLAEAPENVRLPGLEREDDLGELARALRAVQELLVERDVLMERSPIGISWLTADLRWRSVNQAFLAQHGRTHEEVIGRSMLEQVDPEVLARGRHRILAASDTDQDVITWRNSYRRADGTVQWLAITSIPLRDGDGATTGWLAFSQDETQRMQLESQAADLQQRLFPAPLPTLHGYDLGGRCMPADLMMSGDLYDWQVPRDGWLDLTVADVMGKGPAAALLMAALWTSLRAVSSELGPAARLSRAVEPLLPIAGDRFVTLFHARVELATGRFEYVDAGHGHWAIRRAGGELVRPGRRALPLFVAPEVPFDQTTARLGAGDTLVLYTDGLVEVEEQTRALADYAADLDDMADAETMVRSLLGRLPAFLRDDATVVVLRRPG